MRIATRPGMHARLLMIGGCLFLASLAAAASTAGPAAIQWLGDIEVATGAGQRGPWRQNDSDYDFVDDPAVALAADGSGAVAWVDQARKAVLFQRVALGRPGLEAEPLDVSRQPGTFSWIPRLAFAPDAPRQLYVLWQEIVFSGGSHGGEMMLARSSDGGRSFAPPLNLSRSPAGDGKGRLTDDRWDNGSYAILAGPGGVVHVAWTAYEGPLWYSRSTDGGASFSAPRQLGGLPRRPARAPSLARAPDGTVYLAWSEGGEPGADIWLVASRDDGARFGTPRAIVAGPAFADAPRLAVDPAGVLHLVFAEREDAAGAAVQVRYTRSANGGRDVEPARVLSTPFPPRRRGAAFPEIGVDGHGNLLVTWEWLTPRGPRGLGYALSQDGGTRFSAAAEVPGSMPPPGAVNGSSQGLLTQKLAMNAAGSVLVANSSLRPGEASRVWLLPGQLRN